MLTWVKRLFEPSGRGCSRDYNRRVGRYRVEYKNGELSEPMCRDVATDYASIFGGKVVPK